MDGGDMTTATTHNPSSLSGLSSDQLKSLALAPSSTEFQKVSDAMQSNFESGETSGFGSLPLVTFPDGNSVTVREAFGMRIVGALVGEIITNVSTAATIWDALMSNDVIQNFLRTGQINTSGLSQQRGSTGRINMSCLSQQRGSTGQINTSGLSQQRGSRASESASMVADRGQDMWAIIREMLKVLSMWDMIKGFVDQLFLGSGGSIELDGESRGRLLQISLAVSILINLGVLAARLIHMVPMDATKA